MTPSTILLLKLSIFLRFLLISVLIILSFKSLMNLFFLTSNILSPISIIGCFYSSKANSFSLGVSYWFTFIPNSSNSLFSNILTLDPSLWIYDLDIYEILIFCWEFCSSTFLLYFSLNSSTDYWSILNYETFTPFLSLLFLYLDYKSSKSIFEYWVLIERFYC